MQQFYIAIEAPSHQAAVDYVRGQLAASLGAEVTPDHSPCMRGKYGVSICVPSTHPLPYCLKISVPLRTYWYTDGILYQPRRDENKA